MTTLRDSSRSYDRTLTEPWQRVLDALGDLGLQPRVRGNRATSRCPSHPDSSPSLSLRCTDDRVLVHDFGGCEPEMILDALGLSWHDMHAGTGQRTSSPPRRRWTLSPPSRLDPLGDPDHLVRRIAKEREREADPDYWRRRADELAECCPDEAAACHRHAALLAHLAGAKLNDPVRPW